MPKRVKFGRALSGESPEGLLQRLGHTKRLTIDVSPDLHKRIKAACVDEGKKMADVIRAVLEVRFPR